jgi:hypothetical protein
MTFGTSMDLMKLMVIFKKIIIKRWISRWFCECRGPRRILRRSKSLNNANFSTPRDGNIPRMQMFLWNRGPEISPI